MILRKLLKRMEVRLKKKKKNSFKDGPPIDKMVRDDHGDERIFVVTK